MITDARQSEPMPATRYASGTAAPALPAAPLVASELAITSASRASDIANASVRPRMPRRSVPTRLDVSSMPISFLVGEKREDARGCAVGATHLQRRDHDRRSRRGAGGGGPGLDCYPARPRPDA